jgi:hypothetical protein
MMIYPPALCPGDSVAIISPATVVKPEYIDGAAAFLRREGYRPLVMPHAKGPASGSYAAPFASRLSDFREAWKDPSVRAVLCARGGYGCNHMLPEIDADFLRSDPKWLIGFSDVSALHAMMLRAGVASLHAPMAKHLSLEGDDHYCTRALMRILSEGAETEYFAAPDPRNSCGEVTGRIVGGNLAVLNGLAATPFDVFERALHEDTILFIEDISEAIYAVERMLRRLAMAGQLRALRGLVVGSFTEYRPDRNFNNMEDMVSSLLRRLPENERPQVVAFGFPVGHTADNLPLVEGAVASLRVAENGVILSLFPE